MKITTHGQYLTKLTKWGMMNCYLVEEEDGLTLIDTLMAGSGKAILEVAAATGKVIKRIALTHAHVDHIGSIDELHAASPEAEVLIGVREARLMQGDKSLDENEPQNEPRGGFPSVQTRPTRTLNEGDRVGSLEVVFAPGHTPGHIAFLDTRDRSLIAGDALQTKGGTAVSGQLKLLFPLPAFATWHKPTALQSARKLVELEPTRLAVGHGRVLENPVPGMQKAIQAAAQRWE